MWLLAIMYASANCGNTIRGQLYILEEVAMQVMMWVTCPFFSQGLRTILFDENLVYSGEEALYKCPVRIMIISAFFQTSKTYLTYVMQI